MNVVSKSYAKSLKLKIKRSFGELQLGNSRIARSIGTASPGWAFARDPKTVVPIVCHVLPNCTYNLILGNDFFTATQILSRYRDRLTQCSFSTSNNVAQFCFLGETNQRLQGTLGDAHNVLAVPDTGAERNVIDHDSSIIVTPYESNLHPLAPFDFIRPWQRPFEKIYQKLSRNSRASDFQGNSDESANRQTPNRGGVQAEEQRRYDMWNYKYDFGATATTVEEDLERLRRKHYASGLAGAVGHQPSRR